MEKQNEIEKEFALTFFSRYTVFDSDIGKAFKLGYKAAWNKAIESAAKNAQVNPDLDGWIKGSVDKQSILKLKI